MAPIVYYSPHGGKVIAILQDGADEDAERQLDRDGVAWKKRPATAAELKAIAGKDGSPDVTHAHVETDPDGKQRLALRGAS